jgi:hypothetical protein
MRTRVTTNGAFAASVPEPLFENRRLAGDMALPTYAVAPDATRFLTIETERELTQPVMRVVENWLAEFRGTTHAGKD